MTGTPVNISHCALTSHTGSPQSIAVRREPRLYMVTAPSAGYFLNIWRQRIYMYTPPARQAGAASTVHCTCVHRITIDTFSGCICQRSSFIKFSNYTCSAWSRVPPGTPPMDNLLQLNKLQWRHPLDNTDEPWCYTYCHIRCVLQLQMALVLFYKGYSTHMMKIQLTFDYTHALLKNFTKHTWQQHPF